MSNGIHLYVPAFDIWRSTFDIMNRDLISGILLLFLSGWLWFYTGAFPQLDDGYPGPSLFPRLIAIGFGLAGAVLCAGALKKGASIPLEADSGSIKPARMRLGAGLLLVIAYPWLAQWLQFIPIMGSFLLIFALLLRNTLKQALIMAALSAGLMYLMFTKLLGVPL